VGQRCSAEKTPYYQYVLVRVNSMFCFVVDYGNWLIALLLPRTATFCYSYTHF